MHIMQLLHQWNVYSDTDIVVAQYVALFVFDMKTISPMFV